MDIGCFKLSHAVQNVRVLAVEFLEAMLAGILQNPQKATVKVLQKLFHIQEPQMVETVAFRRAVFGSESVIHGLLPFFDYSSEFFGLAGQALCFELLQQVVDDRAVIGNRFKALSCPNIHVMVHFGVEIV